MPGRDRRPVEIADREIARARAVYCTPFSNVPSPRPMRIETALVAWQATATSGIESPLKSPTPTASGSLGVEYSTGSAKWALPRLSAIATE
jgi:hypothetical protein